jgi:glycosyltransferase involved in cell wall biosynthesis
MNKKSPFVSIILPTYNRADLIVDSIESVFAQSFSDYELIVVDDGSTDNTRKLLSAMAKSGELRYEHQENLGLSVARNRGIQLARGELITFLDSDDLYSSDKLQKQVDYLLQYPKAMFVHSWFSKFDEHAELGVRKTSWFVGDVYPDILLQWDVLMAVPCVMMRRSVLDEVDGFDESLKWAEDLDLWRRIARKYAFHVISEALVKVRVHSSSTSSDKSQAAKPFGVALEKAFEDDPSLSIGFQKKAWASMYTNVANNLLGQGRSEQMPLVRDYAARALFNRPLKLGPLFAIFVSFLPFQMRMWLVARLRRLRYPAEG